MYTQSEIISLNLFSFFSESDECASHPCLNNGSCVDKIARFECSCAAGYEGLICQTGRSCD